MEIAGAEYSEQIYRAEAEGFVEEREHLRPLPKRAFDPGVLSNNRYSNPATSSEKQPILLKSRTSLSLLSHFEVTLSIQWVI